MSDASARSPAPAPAEIRRPRGFAFVWLIPIIAAVIAGYLGYRTLLERGPLLTLSFISAAGLNAGQTQIKFKDVSLGTVETVDLSRDNSHVDVKIRMNDAGRRFMTSHARYWVERPRFTAGDISGLDTLVSGAYIAVDPGPPGGRYTDRFTGLEAPPGVRSDEPGRTFQLKAQTIGSLNTGSPVFFRDVQVGEVLGYDIGNGLGPVTVNVFVRAPFDDLVRPQSHFWNSSGITADFEGGAFRLEVQSLQAVLTGGVTFDLPPDGQNGAPSPENSVFALYGSKDEAQSAGYQTKIAIVTYVSTSASGLTRGAPVNVLGIQVGDVTDVRLELDPVHSSARVRVAMELQPDRVFSPNEFSRKLSAVDVLRNLVNNGMRVQIDTLSYITGQKDITLAFLPNAKPADVTLEGDAVVLPSAPGGLDNMIASLSDISAKVAKIPFDKIGDNLNKLLVSANGTIGGDQLKQTLKALTVTLQSANVTLQNLNQSYGGDSNFQYNLGQLMNQANGALRSIQQLSDYLDRHPQALLTGRSGN